MSVNYRTVLFSFTISEEIEQNRKEHRMVMPYQMLQEAVRGRAPMIRAPKDNAVQDDQIQPASIDFRLGATAYAISASALPQPGESVRDLIKGLTHYEFALPRHFDVGKTYLVPIVEECRLPDNVSIQFSPKSSTGRTDVFVRVVADKYPHYDRTPPGYQGKLFLEITPLSFHVQIHPGQSLVQGRFRTTESRHLTKQELIRFHTNYGIVFDKNGEPLGHEHMRISGGQCYFHADLDRDIVGFRAKKVVPDPIDLSRADAHDPKQYWEALTRPEKGHIILNPGEFYLLATKERVRIPDECCAEVLAIDVASGEFRVHYAGFFDNGFGGKSGTHGVLEVRAHDVPFRVVDGQPICAMVFEPTFEIPTKVYGASGSNNYTSFAPSLSKHFEKRHEAWEHAYWRGDA